MDKNKNKKIHPVKTDILNHFPCRTVQIYTNVLLFLLSVFCICAASADNGVYTDTGTESGQSVSADISDNSGKDTLTESDGTATSRNTGPSPSVMQKEKNIQETDDREARPADNVSAQSQNEAVQENAEVITSPDRVNSSAYLKEDTSTMESSPVHDNTAADSIPEKENKEQQPVNSIDSNASGSIADENTVQSSEDKPEPVDPEEIYQKCLEAHEKRTDDAMDICLNGARMTKDPRTEYLVALNYRMGISVAPSHDKQIVWLQKAASKRHPEACMDLALIILDNYNLYQNHNIGLKGVEFLKYAAETNEKARYLYADLMLDPFYIKLGIFNIAEGSAIMEELVNKGNPWSLQWTADWLIENRELIARVHNLTGESAEGDDTASVLPHNEETAKDSSPVSSDNQESGISAKDSTENIKKEESGAGHQTVAENPESVTADMENNTSEPPENIGSTAEDGSVREYTDEEIARELLKTDFISRAVNSYLHDENYPVLLYEQAADKGLVSAYEALAKIYMESDNQRTVRKGVIYTYAYTFCNNRKYNDKNLLSYLKMQVDRDEQKKAYESAIEIVENQGCLK